MYITYINILLTTISIIRYSWYAKLNYTDQIYRSCKDKL